MVLSKTVEDHRDVSEGVLGTLIATRKPMKIAAARRMVETGAKVAARDPAQSKEKDKLDKEARRVEKVAYAKELDCDFYGTAFEIYNVSKRAKRMGGGREIGAASEFCGNLTIGVRHCNWVQKICYNGNASNRKFGAENLLYLASRDGFFNSAFHSKCDLKGATVTIIATADGRLFGGFASTPWLAGTPGRYCNDPSAFLFSLNGHGGEPIKISQSGTSPKDAVFHDSDLGPCFGRALGVQLGA